MTVPFDAFKKTLERYVYEQLIPSIDGLGSKFLAGAYYGLMEKELHSKLKSVGLVSADGKVDTDLIECALKHGFKASDDKVSFSILGNKFTFSMQDWEQMRRMF